MGNFITIPKINAIWLGNLMRERKAHTHTHSPHQCTPSLNILHPRASIQQSTGWPAYKGSEATTDKRELTELGPFPMHASHRGRINTSEFKTKWFC